MTDRVRIGVLGCAGIAGRSVIPAIKALGADFELVAVASRSREKAESFAGQFDCKPVVGYEQLVAAKDVDAVYIPLPTGLHREWIDKALQAGKHVYAEKAFAASLSDAVEMVTSARNNGLALMEGFMFQYHRQHRIVFDLLRAEEIGEIRYFSSSFGFPPLARDNFRYDEQIGGGALLDAAGYTIRAVHFILGRDFSVKGATLHSDPLVGTSMYGSAFLTNSRGIGASVAFGFDNYYQCRYEIWGTKGKLIADRAFTPGPDFSPKIIVETAQGTNIIQAPADNHFVGALREFHRIISNDNDNHRQRHYADILLQSESIDLIRKLSANS